MRIQREAGQTLRIAVFAAIALTIPLQLAAQPAPNGAGDIVAFVSSADVGLGAPPTGLQTIYLEDQTTGHLIPIGQCACGYPVSLSLDGTRVAFRADGPAGVSAAYVKSAPFSGQPQRVDVGDGGLIDVDGTLSGVPALSGNGRFVAFASTANLDRADGDTPGTPDLFVRDLVSGRTERWTLGARVAGSPSISADGRYVAFATASQLLPEDSNQVSDVYLVDRASSSSNLRLLTNPALNAAASGAAIAAGGSAVAFTSAADNLVPGDSNGSADVFVVDLRTGTTTRVSASDGAAAASSFVSISGNGRRVLFAMAARLYLYDLNSRETTAIDGPPGITAGLSPDGRRAILTTPAPTAIVTIALPPDAPAGTNVRTDPFDPIAGQNPLTVTFSSVTAPGNVSLAITTAGPAVPPEFRAATAYFNVSADALTEDGALVCFDARETTFVAAALRLLRFDGAGWVDETTLSSDQGTSLCGHAAALGTFVFATSASVAPSSSSIDRHSASAPAGGTSSPASSNIVTWNVDASGFWDVPTNWSGGVVPGDGDTVVIDRPSGNFVVTVRTTTANVQSVQSAEQLIVTGTLVVSGTASFGGGLTLSGTLTGTGSATLSPAASSSWVGGPNSVISLAGGLTVPAGGALTIGISPGDYPNHFLIDSSLHVHGAVIWTYGAVTIRNSAVIVESDGVWEADNDLSLTSDSSGAPTFTNLGTLRKASTGGQMTLGGTIAFANSGTIDLQTGTIAVTSGQQLINSGFLKLAAGTAFLLDNVTLQAGSTFAGPGQLQANGTTTVTGNVTVTAPLLITGLVTGTGTLHLDASTTWQANGATIISVAGGVDVMAGRTLTISAAPNQLHYLIDSSLHSSGTVVWTGGGLILNGSSTVTNEVGGLWDIQGDVSVGSQGSASPAFTNFGTLRKSAGPGTLTLGGSVVYANTGTIDLQSGVLAVVGPQLTSSGVMQVATGTTVQLDRITLQNGSTFGGAGLLHANGLTTISGNVTITAPLLITGEVTGTGTLHLSAASTWQANSSTIISVTGGVDIATGQTMTVSAAPNQIHYLIDSSLRNHGTVVWTSGALLLRNSSTAVNDAGRLWDAQGDLSIVSDGNGSPAFTNLGTLRKSAGPGALTLGGNVVYLNTGTIDLQSGVLTVSSPGGLNTSGPLQLATGTTVQLDHVTLQASSTFSGTGLLHANGLTTIVGTMTVTAPLLITGEVTGTGTLHLSAAATWQANGSTIISVAGGVDVMTGQTMTVSAAPNQIHYLIDSSLRNHGTVVWTSGALLLRNSSTAVNDAGRLWDAQGDLSIVSDGNGSPAFTNLGTLRKSAGPGALTLGGNVAYFNTGIVDLQSGVITVSGQQLTTSGLLQVTTGTTFQLSRVTLQGGSTFAGTGLLHANGVTTISGTVTVTAPLLITGDVTGTGTLRLSAASTWQANGSTTISVAGGVDIMAGQTLLLSAAPNQTHYLIDSSLRNHGTVLWTGGLMVLRNSSSVASDAAALWEAQSDLSFGSDGNGTPAFTNLGTLRKSAGTGTITLGGNVAYVNAGTIDLQTGTLAVTSGSGLASSGLLKVAASTVLLLDQVTLQAGSTFAGTGLLHANGVTTITGDVTVTAPFLVTGQVTGTGTLHLGASGTWQANSATIFSVAGGVDIMAGRTLTISAAPSQTHFLIDSSLHNHGTVTWTAGGLDLRNSSSITNETDGVWDVQASLSVGFDGSGTPAFVNNGTLRRSGAPNRLTIATPFTNTGTFAVRIGGPGAGQLDEFGGGGVNLNGTLSGQFINGFTPGAGDQFKVMDYPSISGAFATLTGDNFTFSACYTPTALFVCSVVTTKLTPTITWANPADIPFGTALGATQLNATASAPGTFAYSPAAGTILNAGNNQSLQVTFTPTDTVHYTTANASVSLNVVRAMPAITWANAASIVYGTALSVTQLNATAGVPGVFVYAPAAGATLHAGNNQQLSVTFTPTDTANYQPAGKSVTISVLRAPLTVTAVNANKVFGAPLPTFTASFNGLVNGDTPGNLSGTLLLTTAATATSPVGNYPIVPSALLSLDYTIAFQPGTLTITPDSTQTSLYVLPASVGFLQPVYAIAVVAPVAPGAGVPGGIVQFKEGANVLGSASVTSNIAYLVINGLAPGVHNITAAYGGSANFAGSLSSAGSATVQPLAASTFTFLIAQTNPQATGQPATLAAAVIPLGGGTPTGTVQFIEGNTVIGSAAVASGVATISPTTLTVGTHVLSARYLGNAAFAATSSPPAAVTIYSGARPATTASSLTSSIGSSTQGAPVTFTATVTGGASSGTVSFYSDGVPIGTAPLAIVGGSFKATLTTAGLSTGIHVVSASYPGSAGFSSSTSGPVVQFVQAP